jgi:carbon monoxide dehydrogenase subunit G
MLIEGTKIVAARRGEVWLALNDPAFLRRAIPGCRRVERDDDGHLNIGMGAAVGPITADFEVKLEVLEVVEQVSYVLKGQGSAGPVGSAAGAVRVELGDVEGGTVLRYSAETEMTGRIAQLGSRMLDGAARKFSEAFFANIAKLLAPDLAPAPPVVALDRAAGRSSGAIAVAEDANALSQAMSALAWKLALFTAVGAFAGTFLASLVAH